MQPRAPAEVGSLVEDVDTPALLVELEVLERNMLRMAQSLAPTGAKLRPHAKSHKCPTIALRQIELGAVGVCCQKISEAEAMIDGGVRDVLITNQIVGSSKIAKLTDLARRASVAVCVDDLEHIGALSSAAQTTKVVLDVLVEIEVGTNRCGVPPGLAALELARRVAAAPALRFRGLQAYSGAAQHQREHIKRVEAAKDAIAWCRATRDLLRLNGIECPVISGAGTGTWQEDAASRVYTELQPGTYIFMDADYMRNRDADGNMCPDFEQSLFVWATVISRPAATRAVVDAGLKAVSIDKGMPLVHGVDGTEYVRASDEHGVLSLQTEPKTVKLGSKLRLVPGNCDPTVNMHDWLVAIRHGRVEALWPISARGPGL